MGLTVWLILTMILIMDEIISLGLTLYRQSFLCLQDHLLQNIC